jgi:hypothetical protein
MEKVIHPFSQTLGRFPKRDYRGARQEGIGKNIAFSEKINKFPLESKDGQFGEKCIILWISCGPQKCGGQRKCGGGKKAKVVG